jgi:hypothetical protein
MSGICFLTSVISKTVLLQDVKPCNLISRYKSSGGSSQTKRRHISEDINLHSLFIARITHCMGGMQSFNLLKQMEYIVTSVIEIANSWYT